MCIIRRTAGESAWTFSILVACGIQSWMTSGTSFVVVVVVVFVSMNAWLHKIARIEFNSKLKS